MVLRNAVGTNSRTDSIFSQTAADVCRFFCPSRNLQADPYCQYRACLWDAASTSRHHCQQKCWKTQCFYKVLHPIIMKTRCFSMILRYPKRASEEILPAKIETPGSLEEAEHANQLGASFFACISLQTYEQKFWAAQLRSFELVYTFVADWCGNCFTSAFQDCL